jgi:outer membrane protein
LIVKRTAIVFLYAALLAGSASAVSAELKIGVVNIQRLANESPQAKAATEAIQSEFSVRYQDLMKQDAALQARQEKLTKDAATMSEIQRSAADKELRDGARDLQAKKAAFQDDLNARNEDEKAKLLRALDEEVVAFAKAQNYDLILADGVLFATSALDVTEALMQSMQGRKTGATTPAPATGAAGKKTAPPSIAKP